MTKEVIVFSSEKFAALIPFLSVEEGYSTLSLADVISALEKVKSLGILSEFEFSSLEKILEDLTFFLAEVSSGHFDVNSLLLCKVDEGVPTIFPPAFFASPENQLLLKSGNNAVEATQEGEILTLGKCVGKIVVKEKGYISIYVKVVVKTASAEEKVFFVPAVLSEELASVNLSETELSVKAEEIVAALESGEPLASFLRVLGEGGMFVKLRDLDLGVYPLAGVEYIKEPKFPGQNWLLVLADGRKLSPNAYLKTILNALLERLDSVDKVSVLISHQQLEVRSKKYEGGKCYVKCSLSFLRPMRSLEKGLPPKKQSLPGGVEVDSKNIDSQNGHEEGVKEEIVKPPF